MSGRLRLFARFVLGTAIVMSAAGNVIRIERGYALSSAATVLRGPAAQALPIFGSWSGDLPRERRIVDDSDAPQLVEDGLVVHRVAHYSPFDQSLHRSAYLRTLPQPRQDATLRHEYGHVLMADVVNRGVPGGYLVSRESTNTILQLTQDSDAAQLPEELRPVFEDFLAAKTENPTIYGGVGGAGRAPVGYYTSNFGEFFAQSFAALCEGSAEVPPATRAALERIEALR